jgi:Domain of unknown function (DUF4410)
MKLNCRNAIAVLALLALSFAAPTLRADEKRHAQTKHSAIQVMKLRSDSIAIPREFQVSLYENLIDQLQKKAVFQNVYRDGDRNAKTAADLITLQCSVVKFTKGNETMRQVTTIAGASSITLRCQFVDKSGNFLLVRDITGKVRFLGGNLKATYDFAKKAATIAEENL